MDGQSLNASEQRPTIFSLPLHIIQSICQLSVDSSLVDREFSRFSFVNNSFPSYKSVLALSSTCSHFRSLVLDCSLRYRLCIKVNVDTLNLTENVEKFLSFVRSKSCWRLTKLFVQIRDEKLEQNSQAPKLSSFLNENSTVFGNNFTHLSILVIGKADSYFKWFYPLLQETDYFTSENLRIFLTHVARHFNPDIFTSFPAPHKVTQIGFLPKSPKDLICLSRFQNLKLLKLVDSLFSLNIAHLSLLQNLEELQISDLILSKKSASIDVVIPYLKSLKDLFSFPFEHLKFRFPWAL